MAVMNVCYKDILHTIVFISAILYKKNRLKSININANIKTHGICVKRKSNYFQGHDCFSIIRQEQIKCVPFCLTNTELQLSTQPQQKLAVTTSWSETNTPNHQELIVLLMFS